MNCQEQSNGSAPCSVLYTSSRFHDIFYHEFECITYFNRRVAFSVARFDNPGNAKALTRGTGDRLAPRFFVYIHIFKKGLYGVSRNVTKTQQKS